MFKAIVKAIAVKTFIEALERRLLFIRKWFRETYRCLKGVVKGGGKLGVIFNTAMLLSVCGGFVGVMLVAFTFRDDYNNEIINYHLH